jgi:hypothetical protein
MIRKTGREEASMKNRNAATALFVDIPSPDLERARQLIMISIGFWLCIGVLTALQTGSFA